MSGVNVFTLDARQRMVLGGGEQSEQWMFCGPIQMYTYVLRKERRCPHHSNRCPMLDMLAFTTASQCCAILLHLSALGKHRSVIELAHIFVPRITLVGSATIP